MGDTDPILCEAVPSAKGAWALLLPLLSWHLPIPSNQPEVLLLGDTHTGLLGPPQF